jgi:hypothetical protein
MEKIKNEKKHSLLSIFSPHTSEKQHQCNQLALYLNILLELASKNLKGGAAKYLGF